MSKLLGLWFSHNFSYNRYQPAGFKRNDEQRKLNDEDNESE